MSGPREPLSVCLLSDVSLPSLGRKGVEGFGRGQDIRLQQPPETVISDLLT